MNNQNSQNLSLKNITFAFIGAGNMAKALIKGLLSIGHEPESIIASNPTQPKLQQLQDELGIATTLDNQRAVNFANVVVLAVKPQKLQEVLALLDCSTASTIISVAAGTNTQSLKDWCKHDAIVRAMPNTPISIGLGATGCYAAAKSKSSLTSSIAHANYLFGAAGIVEWINDEILMDTVTAIAGSSPAYFFLMVEAMIAAAHAQGMDQAVARSLIVQSALGASTLMQQQSDLEIAELRRQVTSPNGTTAAAIASLQHSQIERVFAKAIKAATDRGVELSQ